jgi:hypothetical protein
MARSPAATKKPIDEYPDRRDCASAHLCDHLPPGRREDHVAEKTNAVWRADPMGGRSQGAGERRRVRSGWMAVERERGISVSSAVMNFEHEGLAFNLLDTPGHQDFSPMGFQRGHLPHPDRGRQCGNGARRRPNGAEGASRSRPANSSRSAGCATCRSSPLPPAT